MQRFKNVGDLFQDEPWQWGLRGDAFLWEEMKKHLSKVPLPNSPEELRGILFQAFNELTGRPISSRDHFIVERFSHGGMSSGHVDPKYWRNTAIPTLMRRLNGYTAENRETVRLSYKPARISILFVGESPPEGDKFFYYGDGQIVRSTAKAFAQAFRVKCPDAVSFLSFFKSCGCFLEDMCHEPINNSSRADRDAKAGAAIGEMACQIQAASPKRIVVILKLIAPHVLRAAQTANFPADAIHYLSFPGYGHQREFESSLTEILQECIQNNVFDCEDLFEANMPTSENAFLAIVKTAIAKRWCTQLYCTTCGSRDYRLALQELAGDVGGPLADALSAVDINELTRLKNWEDATEIALHDLPFSGLLNGILETWYRTAKENRGFRGFVRSRIIPCLSAENPVRTKWEQG